MKRIIAVFMMVIIMLGTTISATATEFESDTEVGGTSSADFEILKNNAVTFQCNYSEDDDSVEIQGSIKHDTVVSYGKYTIEILKILPTQTPEEAINAEEPAIMATMDMSMQFDFFFDAEYAVDRFSRYAVLFRSETGEIVLAAEPQFVYVESDYKFADDRLNFKGAVVPGNADDSLYSSMGFGTVIIPIYYDKMTSPSSTGYMFPFEDSYCYLDKDYIDGIENKIKLYSAAGGDVYIQLLLSSDNSEFSGFGGKERGASYSMPNVYDSYTLAKISAYIEFLASRFDNYTDGIISGFIVGDAVDTYTSNYNGGMNVDDYAEMYAFYLTVVANSARHENHSLDIVIPVSSFDAYSSDDTVRTDGYITSELLERITSYLENSFLADFKCNSAVISDTLSITTSDDGGYTVSNTDNDMLDVTDLNKYASFLSELNRRYDSAPEKYMYILKLGEELQGDDLAAEYAYTYYSLLGRDMVSSFVVSVNNEAFVGNNKLIKYIDTDDSQTVSSYLLSRFGISTWDKIIKNYSKLDTEIREVYKSNISNIESTEWTSSFSYFDFTSGNIDNWSGVLNTKGLRVEYGSDGSRAMRQAIQGRSDTEYSSLLCLYKYNENFAHTPAVVFELEITDSESSAGELYEVVIELGCNGKSVESTHTVKTGEINKLWVDMSVYNGVSSVSYIKISTRAITGGSDEYSLWLYDVVGHNSIYNDHDLAYLINLDRSEMRDLSDVDDSEETNTLLYTIVFVIVLMSVVIAGLLFVIFRRDEGNKNRETDDNDTVE